MQLAHGHSPYVSSPKGHSVVDTLAPADIIVGAAEIIVS